MEWTNCFVEFVLFQNVSGGGVDFAGGGAFANGGDAGQLGFEHGAVHFADPFGGFAQMDGARHVAGVAFEARAHIDQE